MSGSCRPGVSSSEEGNGCKHYVRRCLVECPTCLEFYSCRLCHDDDTTTHKLDRFAVRRLKCSTCQSVQPTSSKCKDCNMIFGKYHCSICNMFDDRDKKQYHCDACGLCRVGGRDNFFHCDKCSLCLSNDIKDSHKCVERSSKSDCPVCLEDLHSSTRQLQVPACGHLIHLQCYHTMLRHGQYQCSICGRSTLDMSETWKKLNEEIAATPMPREYADTQMWILCKDCNSVTEAKFHVLGMKCGNCNSYNTCGSDPPAATISTKNQ